MNQDCLLSLCIPTNGVVEWVIPVVESIVSQKVDYSQYEIVISDNGSDNKFQEKIQKLQKSYTNLKYFKSNSVGFTNQIDCFNKASGKLLKFVNHRMPLKKGAIEYLLNIAQEFEVSQPVMYFTNGRLNLSESPLRQDTFDGFVRSLSYYSSWSAGLAVWRNQLQQLNQNNKFNPIFPHIDILFNDSEASQYLIFDQKIMEELPTDASKKGKYNLFLAFAVEYPRILLSQLCLGKITIKTFNYVKNQNEKFLAYLYMKYKICNEPSSYTFENLDKLCNIFYRYRLIQIHGRLKWLKHLLRTLKK